MKKHFSFLLFYFIIICISDAQNLVPNPSFEQFTNCPYDISQTSLLQNWNYISFTPDYFNQCDTSNTVSIPNNLFGFQNNYLPGGNAYVGVYCRSDNTGLDAREIIGAKMSDSLAIGQRYYASVRVSLADCLPCATNNIGMLFTTTPIYLSFPIVLPNHTQIHSTAIITDTFNWVTISGSFIADSFYKYVFLGNFYDDAHTNFTIVNSNPCSGFGGGICNSYYYLDDICVSTDSLTCNLNTGINGTLSKNEINVYPNPATSLLNISLPELNKSLSISNIVGKQVYFTQERKRDFKIDVSGLPNGIYFIQMQSEKNIQSNKFIINK